MGVVIVGTLDTKAEEIGFARDVIEAQGVDVHVVDTGVVVCLHALGGGVEVERRLRADVAGRGEAHM